MEAEAPIQDEPEKKDLRDVVRRERIFPLWKSIHRLLFLILLVVTLRESKPTAYHFDRFRDVLVDQEVESGKVRIMRKLQKKIGKKIAKTSTSDFYLFTINTLEVQKDTYIFIGAFSGFLPIYMS